MTGDELLISANQAILASKRETPGDGSKTLDDTISRAEPLSTVSPLSPGSLSGSVTPSSGDEALPSPRHGLGIQQSTAKRTGFKLGAMSIDEDRPFKVVVIGAGFSGILAAIRFVSNLACSKGLG